MIPDDAVLVDVLGEQPQGECDACHRKTWTAVSMNQPCDFPQPDGSRCKGRFGPLPPSAFAAFSGSVA